MNTPRRFNTETLLFFIALALAVVLRLLHLGNLPLSDREAEAALQAWQAAQGLRPILGAQPGYVALTAALFYVFQGSNLLARLVPAVAGSLLVLVPWILRARLPGRSAIYLAFIFALEPGLLALSRAAGGAMMAVSFTLLALAFWLTRRPYWAGAFGGLALLSGPALLPGLIGIGLSILMNGGRLWDDPAETADGWVELQAEPQPGSQADSSRADALRALLVAAGVFVFAGSLLFLLSPGLGAAFSAIQVYLQGWASLPEVPFYRLLLALVVYQPLGIIFALVGLVYGISARLRFSNWLGFWLLTALVLALAYPSRQVADLAWALIPLWALAALGLDRALDFSRENIWETAGLLGLTLTLLGFAYLNFLSLAAPTAPAQDATLRWIFTGGTIVMLGVVIALVALGWSTAIAKRGAVWGIVTALGVYTLSAAFGAAGLRADPGAELWQDAPIFSDADLLALTLDQLSDTSRGAVDSLPVTVYGVDSPALLWVLRDWNVEQADATPVGSASPLILGPDQPDVSFGAVYRGQDFIWHLDPAWESASLQGWLHWLVSREMPTRQDKIVLWARTDLFPDSQNTSP